MAEDGELYRAWAEGDRSAGAALIDRYLAAVSRFFANKAIGPADIEDLVATTFERCARSLGGLRDPSRFRSYLYGIAANALRDDLRRRRPDAGESLFEVAVADLGPSPSAVAAQREQERVLLAALRAIPVEHQIVLELSLLEELSRSEIAEILALPAGTVASRLARAKILLEAQVQRLAANPQLIATTMHQLVHWARGIRDALAVAPCSTHPRGRL